MENKNFSILDAFKFSFKTILDNLVFVLSINLGYFIFLIIPILFLSLLFGIGVSFSQIFFAAGSLFDQTKILEFSKNQGINVLFVILGFLLLSLLISLAVSIYNIGVYYIALKLYDGLTVKFSDLFTRYNLVLRIIMANFLYFLIIVIGLAFFVLPGVFFAVRFMFYEFLIIDKNLAIIESFKQSYQLTQNLWWKLFFALILFQIVTGLITQVPLLSLFFGTFVIFSLAHIYRSVLKSEQ